MPVTFHTAMGRTVLEKVLAHPGKYSPAVISKASEALKQLGYWEEAASTALWQNTSETWAEFRNLLPVEDWPALLEDTEQ